MPSELSGTELGNYRLVSPIGKGGMGEVWLARHPLLGREVAVKVLAPALSGDEEALGRFRREALTVNQIDHSSVVEVTDFGTLEDGRAYCVMELLRGESLEQYLAAQGPLSVHDAVAILIPVMEGLAAAHSAGVVHRDVKPDNIYLDTGKGGQRLLRILDFGIAKLLDPGDDDERMTKTGQLLGTPLYMSPEQVSGEIQKVGPWSDVYSLGVLLYRMLAGRPPFVGESFGQVLMHHLQTPPPSIVDTRPEIPAAVDEVIQRAMAKTPDERFADMTELSGELIGASAYDGTPPTIVAASSSTALDATLSPSDLGLTAVDHSDAATAPTVTPADLTPMGPTVAVDTTADAQSHPSEDPPKQAPQADQVTERAAPVAPPRKRRSGGLILGMVALVITIAGVATYLLTRPAPKPRPPQQTVKEPPRPRPRSLVPKDMVGVPAGCFTMGAASGDPDENPPHRVCLASYAVERTEVTVTSYGRCVKAGVCSPPTGYLASSDPTAKGAWKARCNWNAPGRGDHPVNCIRWQRARTYCKWRGRRLPTEAEWEYAARGRKKRFFPWGSAAPTCERLIMKNASGTGCGKETTWPVGSKPAGRGPFGALDQAGNVWEWTEDCWALRFYDECAKGCSNPFNHCVGHQKRVIRGASFTTGSSKPGAFRASLRGFYRPDSRGQGLGFRCAKSLPHGAVPGDPHMDARPLTITRVKASSYLPKFKDHTFKPEHVADGRLDTSWQPRGSKTDSKGQFLRLWLKPRGAAKSPPSVLVTAISVANGYQAVIDGVDQFYANSRLRLISVHFSDGSHQRAFLPPNRKGLIRLRLSPKRTKWLLLQIEAIYPGKKYRDVGISELKVWGKP